MKDLDLIIDLYRYFSQFVPKTVLEKMFQQQSGSKHVGYDELESEILSMDDDFRIHQIETFVLSINEKFVSDRIKNTSGVILFIEYGKFNIDKESVLGVKEDLSIAIVQKLPSSNNDNINEILIMNNCLQILDTIIHKMEEEQENLIFCGNSKLIEYPITYHVVDPVEFYGFGGWAATLNNAKTILK